MVLTQHDCKNHALGQSASRQVHSPGDKTMFILTTPFWVLNTSGFVVELRSARLMGQFGIYRERHRWAEAPVEFGKPRSIYASHLGNWNTGEGEVPMTAAERELVLKRMCAGIEAMGHKTIIFRPEDGVR